MNYIDTNVIISYLNKKDVNHSRALKILDKGDRMITSPIGILELRSVLSRTTNLDGDEIEAFVDYLPEIKLEVPEVDMNTVFSSASEIAIRIRMKTLDILHLSASVILNASNFVTFDGEFAEKENEIAAIGLKVITG
ncbi:MAG: type II toxin-antitoxin system VapC family toxin [Thermoplasmataceae archaeon]